MPRPVGELRLDVEELKRLSESSNRQTVKDVLSVEIRRLETEISQQTTDTFNLESKPSAHSTVVKCYDVKLTNYAWDQSDKFLKLFVTLKNVQNLPSENVTCQFSERSLELKVKELEGKNYTLTIKNLLEVINVEKSHWKVKSDSVTIFLAKLKTVTWSSVTVDEKRSKDAKAPKVDDSLMKDDPNASLMNMMKQLYDTGDDEMKRQIAKSFAEGRNKPTDLGL